MKTHQSFPAISCPRVENALPDRASVEEAFCDIPATALDQAWTQEKEFRSGRAKIAHTENALLVFTEFEDEDVFNPVSEFNHPAYMHGDVCEVFWLPENANQYAEIHVTPDGAIWQVSRFSVNVRKASGD